MITEPGMPNPPITDLNKDEPLLTTKGFIIYLAIITMAMIMLIINYL